MENGYILNSLALTQAVGIVPWAEEIAYLPDKPEQQAKKSLPRWKAFILSTTALLFAACSGVDAGTDTSTSLSQKFVFGDHNGDGIASCTLRTENPGGQPTYLEIPPNSGENIKQAIKGGSEGQGIGGSCDPACAPEASWYEVYAAVCKELGIVG